MKFRLPIWARVLSISLAYHALYHQATCFAYKLNTYKNLIGFIK